MNLVEKKDYQKILFNVTFEDGNDTESMEIVLISEEGLIVLHGLSLINKGYKTRPFKVTLKFFRGDNKYVILATEDGYFVSISTDYIENLEEGKMFMPSCIASKIIKRAIICRAEDHIVIQYDNDKTKIIAAQRIIDNKTIGYDSIGLRRYLINNIKQISIDNETND